MPTLRFTDEDWRRTLESFSAWWEGALERPLCSIAVTDDVGLRHRRGFFTNYPAGMSADEIVECYVPYLEATRWYGDAFPYVWCNFGPGMLAGFLGCRVHSVTEPSETVWFSPPAPATASSLSLRYDPRNRWWARVLDVTKAFVRRFGDSLVVGHVDLGGNLDVLASFLGTQELLLELTDEPSSVERLVREISALWIRYYDEQAALLRGATRGTSAWTPLLSSGTTYMLQSDFSYMISPAMFDRFVMPDLVAVCERLDHAFYHLDGKGEIPHLDSLLSLERLRGIQWIPGDGQPPPEKWLPLLKRIRDGGKLCQLFVTPRGALTIARELGGKGFYFVVNSGLEELPDEESIRGYLRELQSA